MPDNALAKAAPAVLTTAEPDPELLLGARMLVQQDETLQGVFRRAREEKWTAAQVALHIEEPLQGRLNTDDPQKVVQVARYLADEYEQMGDTMLLIDRTTGRAIGKFTDADVYQPVPVPREDGRMAVPLPRLRPELEAGIIMWHFEKGREERILAEIAPTLHPTDLLKEMGDPRLLPLTRAGRSTIVDQLREELPKLLSMASGTVGQFLTHFDIRTEDPPQGHPYEPLLSCQAIARNVQGIQDPKAMNLHYNRLHGLRGHVANAWGREIARPLAAAAKKHFTPTPKPYTAINAEDRKGIDIWVGEPDTVDVLARQVFEKKDRQSLLPVENSPTIGVLGKVGAVVVKSESYECQGRELFDRWEVAAKFEYTLWVDWSQVRAFDLTNVPMQGHAVLTR